ncbi:enoyl-CoA hydratase/isomerase family protein [Legionella israelensis]|uniref:enoyl-CoA hydratase/isomerase family protein n=1 Tax=Legionella israelensis TaxID=454 RepID=UPI00117DCC03|nr:enoyl-CoA hydratase/isomerase family protein [Legionella israelensis]QDP73023.1 enoyl-CoA hydratase/isomerase family protein [Legionella israelensis]
MTEDVLFSQKGPLGLITLNRPASLNALSLSMIKLMQEQLQHWQQEPDIKAVVLQAKPGKAFCAGGDVRWLYEAGMANHPEQMRFFEHEYRLNHFIHHFPKPYISLMDGITMGGGVGISLHGAHPVASENFVFAMPETGIGFFPDIGASYLLARCPNNLGVYLGLTGHRLNAKQALGAGLVKFVINSRQMPLLVDTLAQCDLSMNAHQQVSDCLKSFASQENKTLNKEEWSLINTCFSKATVELILSALEEAGTKEAERVYQDLLQKAPLSLKVTLEQIHRAKDLTLAECLKMDYVLVHHFMRDHDFYEGIRALLIDKDKSPKWQPAELSQTSNAKVAEYFETIVPDLEL